MGHNEYLGILGVGSNYTAANSQTSTLLFLKLKELRIFQLLQDLYGRIKTTQEPAEKIAKASRTFMAKVAKHKNIPFGSPLYHAGIEQFDRNLGLLLVKYKDAGVPVYIATLASNLRDHSPFASVPLGDEHKDKLQAVSDSLNNDKASLAKTQIALLIEHAASLKHALLYYHLGQLQAELGDMSGAAGSFQQAKELDLLRFRAPEAINKVIRKHAQKHDNVYLVDVARRLAMSSPDKIVGNNLMLEHLHPNVQGYFLLADTFYQSMEKNTGSTDWQNVDIAKAWRARPLIPSEEYLGFAKILHLKSDYPFTNTPKKLPLPRPSDWQQELGKQQYLKKIDWVKMMQQALARYRAENDHEMSHKVTQLLADALPHDGKINQLAGDLFRDNHRHRLSIYYYLRSISADKNNTLSYVALINAYKQTGQAELAKIWQEKLAALKVKSAR
jgi:tetratricopeptide (TPR) repeat protein